MLPSLIRVTGSPPSATEMPIWAGVAGCAEAFSSTLRDPSVSRMAQRTAARSVTPLPRSSSQSSSREKRHRRSSFSTILPSRMRMLGRPKHKARKRLLFRLSQEMISSQEKRMAMGSSPLSRGIPMSCRGWAAMSVMRTATTSSLGSSSPSWRFPMRRIAP